MQKREQSTISVCTVETWWTGYFVQLCSVSALRKIISRLIVFFSLLFFCTLSVEDVLADNVVYLSSLEWPPYTGESLVDNGESAKIVREAFAVMGYELKIVFVPWKRAMRMVESDVQVAGYFPEYYSAKRADKYLFSKPYSCSPVGLLMRRRNPVHWDSVNDLAGYRLGFVAGYVNTKELDDAVANGSIIADYAPHDESNIIKIAKGRVDAGVIDPLVYDYILKSSPEMDKLKSTVVMHEKIFGMNELYIAFNDDPTGRKYVRIFNEGLKRMRTLHSLPECKVIEK